jgi:hypothetical protein
VAEECLQLHNIGSVREQIHRERVTKSVHERAFGDRSSNASLAIQALNGVLDLPSCDTFACFRVDDEGLAVVLSPVTRESVAPVFEVSLQQD